VSYSRLRGRGRILRYTMSSHSATLICSAGCGGKAGAGEIGGSGFLCMRVWVRVNEAIVGMTFERRIAFAFHKALPATCSDPLSAMILEVLELQRSVRKRAPKTAIGCLSRIRAKEPPVRVRALHWPGGGGGCTRNSQQQPPAELHEGVVAPYILEDWPRLISQPRVQWGCIFLTLQGIIPFAKLRGFRATPH
jgi:hypothetical protein